MDSKKIPQNHSKEYLVSFSDLKIVCRRAKKKIWFGALIAATITSLYTLSQPVKYYGEGTFREKAKADSPEKSLSTVLTGGGTTAENIAISTLKSRKISEKVVEELGLQAEITPKSALPKPISKMLDAVNNIKDNLKVEYALLRGRQRPSLKDTIPDLTAIDVSYVQEIAIQLVLQGVSSTKFEVIDPETGSLGEASIGLPFKTNDFSFTLLQNAVGDLEGKNYYLTLKPQSDAAKRLSDDIKVQSDRLDKGLIRINVLDKNRYLASEEINSLMNAYRGYLIADHQRQAGEQIAYLHKRREEMGEKLKQTLEEHAENISSNTSNIEFLISTQQNYKKRLLAIDLETRHLQKALHEGSSYLEQHAGDGENPSIHKLASEIASLRQQADALDLTLRSAPLQDPDKTKKLLDKQLEAFAETEKYQNEIRLIESALQKDIVLQNGLTIHKDPKYLVNTWLEKTLAARGDTEKANTSPEWTTCKSHFCNYLKSLSHLFEVQEKSIKDRLHHQQSPQEDFQGISLETAQQLYITYSKELHESEAARLQTHFILEQLENPGFELSSLSSALNDPVSRDMISKASALSLAIKDEDNRTSKEIGRLNQELDLQKTFLKAHLAQIVQLSELREELFKQKIASLQSTTLELIQQRISILEKHMQDFAKSQMNSLTREKEVIEQHSDEIQRELVNLPSKWASQKIVDQQMEINKRIVQDIASLVEQKNIYGNVEISQSAPLDNSLVQVYPKSPYTILFALFGAFLGGFFTLAWVFIKSVGKGIEASPENLTLSNENVTGTLTSRFSKTQRALLDNDLDVLRRALIFYDKHRQTTGKAFLVIEEGSHLIAEKLCQLLSERGEKTLLFPLSFLKDSIKEESPGLLEVLSRAMDLPKINAVNDYFEISQGGISRFALEKTSSKQFENILSKISADFDAVILYSEAAPASAEAQGFFCRYQSALIALNQETLNELTAYFKTPLRPDAEAAFLFKTK